MIQKCSREQYSRLTSLFKGWHNTMVLSCLEGEMGDAYSTEEMMSAKLDIGDFCFFGGKANENLLYHKKSEYENQLKILVPQTLEWEGLIEKVYGEKVISYKRYSFKRKEEGFSQKELLRIVNGLDADFTLTNMEECRDLFDEVSRTSWAGDWISQFSGYEDYRKRGIGTVLKYKGELVAGASSYAVYSGGIEIQIDTREDFRNQGLGKICGAALILRCLEQGRYPSWDADNEISAHLACSLGYEQDREYTVYRIQQSYQKDADNRWKEERQR